MIDLDSIAEFTWDFGQNFILKVDNRFYIWSDPDYNGDNTIRPLKGTFAEYFRGFFGRDKGTHRISDYCGQDVVILSES